MVAPVDWQEVRLGEVCEANWGNTSVTKASYINSGVTAFSASGPDGYVSWHERSGEGIVLSAIGALCGKTWLARGEWTPIKNTIWIQSRVPDCNVRYLYHATGRPDVWPSRGAAQPFISLGDVRDLLVKLPPLKEQEAIAEALSDADAAIEALGALIAKKRDVKQAAMQQLLTGRTRLPGFSDDWREVQVGDVALVDPEALGMSTPADYAFRYISLENTFRGRLLGWSEERFGTAPSRARRVLRSGDFLFATVRPNLLGHHLFLRSEPDWVCSTGFSVLRSRPEICGAPFFAQHFFSQRIISQVELLISGSNYPAINSRDVSRLRLTVPCLQEQGAIAEVLSDMDSEIEALVAERDKMRLVKQGMMQELLSGRVRLV